MYLGNPNAFNAMAGAGAIQFARTIGTDRMFSSASQDCSNKYATAELLYGVTQANPIPDLERTELLLVIGSNPRVSKSSFLSVPDPVKALRAIRDRGGRVVFVNPLVIEPGIGETLQLRPDTDPYLLAAMLHEIERTPASGWARSTATSRTSTRSGRSSRPYSPEVVAPIVGLAGGADHRARAARSPTPTARRSTCRPVSTWGGRDRLAYWLTQMLVLLTGNLDRPGGNYFAAPRVPDRPGTRGSHRGVVRADQVGPVPADRGHDARLRSSPT